jgi:hypothetical protein
MGGSEGFNKKATDFWRHLDDLSSSDPNAYKVLALPSEVIALTSECS